MRLFFPGIAEDYPPRCPVRKAAMQSREVSGKGSDVLKVLPAVEAKLFRRQFSGGPGLIERVGEKLSLIHI